MNFILEINSKSNERVFIDECGLTVGRSLDNDVIINDRFVDENQITVSMRDGQLFVQDLGSTNGTEISGRKINGEKKPYQVGESIAIGDTELRFLSKDSGVEKTSVRSRWFYFIRSFKPMPLFILVMCTVGFFEILESWLYATEVYGIADATSDFFTTVFKALLLGACFAVFSKLLKGRSLFKEHAIIVGFILILETVIEFWVWGIRFNLQNYSIGEGVATFAGYFATVLLLVGAISYITYLKQWGVWLLSIVLVAAYYYNKHSDEFTKQSHERWTKSAPVENVAFPPAYLFRHPVSVDDYFSEADKLFDEIENAD